MESVDLEKYKAVWKNEKSFDERRLSGKEISKFMQSSSKSMAGFFRTGLLMDVSFKVVLLMAAFVLFFFISNQGLLNLMNLAVAILTASGLYWQINSLMKISSYDGVGKNVLDRLRGYIDFYHKHYIYSIYVSAFSSTLFFLIGSAYYLRLKYREIPDFQIDDIAVLSIGVLLSYGLSAVVQLRHGHFRIKQLEECLVDAEENAVNTERIRNYRVVRRRNAVLFGIALIVGVILLLYLISMKII